MIHLTKNIETEIEEATNRISTRTVEIEKDLSLLDNKIKTYTNWAWGFVWAGIIVAVIGVAMFICRTATNYNLNLLGDFLGGSVASLWSLAGLFFIYVAFLGQKQQLLNQQLEIMYSQLEVKYTRLELEGQKNEMIEQNKTLRQQRFETTFFQLLRNHQDIVNGIDIRRYRQGQSFVQSEGRDCFKSFYEMFKYNLRTEQDLDSTLKVYMAFYVEHQSDLGHYFRHLYHILKFVKNATEVKGEEKFKYTSLLRALLSSFELALLFYNCLGEYGEEYFKPLVEEFSFLKNLDRELVFNQKHLEEYDELAFASSEKRKQLLIDRQKTDTNIGSANSGA